MEFFSLYAAPPFKIIHNMLKLLSRFGNQYCIIHIFTVASSFTFLTILSRKALKSHEDMTHSCMSPHFHLKYLPTPLSHLMHPLYPSNTVYTPYQLIPFLYIYQPTASAQPSLLLNHLASPLLSLTFSQLIYLLKLYYKINIFYYT